FKVLRTILKLFKNYKPFAFFTMIAVLLSLLALGFFIPVLIKFINLHIVDQIPTLVMCGFVALAAIQSFFAGLILSNMSGASRREFEQSLLQANREFRRLLKKEKKKRAEKKQKKE
nr:glycosyl transferase [Lachnospiraceae bacterium]